MSGPVLLDPAIIAGSGMDHGMSHGSSPAAGGRRTVTIIRTSGGNNAVLGQGQIMQTMPAPGPIVHRTTTPPEPQVGWNVTIVDNMPGAKRAFEIADAQRVMGSAWRLTEEYFPFLGKIGVVSEVAAGAVRVVFHDSPHLGQSQGGLWFPMQAIAQIFVPASSPSALQYTQPQLVPPQQQPPPPQQGMGMGMGSGLDLATAEKLQSIASLCETLPPHAVAATLRGVVEACPSLAGPVLASLQSQLSQLQGDFQQAPFQQRGPDGGWDDGHGQPTPPPNSMPGGPVAPQEPQKGSPRRGKRDGSGTPQRNADGRGLNPHSPPFQSSKGRAKLQQDALRKAADSAEATDGFSNDVAFIVKDALGE
eukprot:TRINITY_DN1399_c0_g1_i1.p1 TRINITY_DN1399_c0_g1~~TRINITY_DN1399_c0_g1_i1.p1  ORF type:complete len:363 (+),score=85.48 TRINITY_DN1399_c0_g1_i1:103-1191(+)